MSATKKIATATVAQAKIHPVSKLAPEKEHCAIVVRVLRKWDVFTKRGGDKPVAVEMVLVDKEGTRIQAHIDKPYIYKHGDALNEGSVYNISKFAVALNYGEYRAARHEYKLNIKYQAVIKSVSADEVEVPPYQFTPPEEFFDKDFNKNFLVDVTGVLTGIGQEKEFQSPTGMSTRMRIDLDNRGYRFSVTLFGEYTNEMKTFISSGGAPGDVVAVLFCKVGTWPGGTSIQTTMRTSKLLFNPDIPESALLRETISQAITTTPLTITQTKRTNSAQESFLNMDQKFTLADVRDMLEVNEFVATANINSIVDDLPWWYWACRVCNRKCTEDEDVPNLYYCKFCNTHVTKVIRKLFLKLLLIDETDSITVVLFDNTARILIGRPAEDVFRAWKEDPGNGDLPSEVVGLKGREAIWRIQAEQRDGDRFPRSYRVQNVSEDIEVIKTYKDKWASEATIEGNNQEVLLIEDTPTSGVVALPKNAAGVTQDLIQKFDQTSSDSTTVVASTEMVDITRDTDETPPAKRKAAIDAASSSSKLPLKNIKVEK